LDLNSFSEQLCFAGTRFLLAGLLILPFCRRNIVKGINAAPKLKLFIIILCQTFLQYFFFYYGLGISSGTLGALLVGTGSFWWLLLAPILTSAPTPTLRHWAIVSLAFAGISIALFNPGAGSGRVLMGSLAFLATSISSAIAAIFMKGVAQKSGSRTTTAVSLSVGGLMLLAINPTTLIGYLMSMSKISILVTLYLAMLSAIAFSIWNHLIEKYSFQTLSTYRFLIPLFGIIESILFIESESLSFGIVLGGSLVLFAIFLISREREPSDEKATENPTE